MSDENKALVKQLMDGVSSGDLGVVDTLIADGFVEHEELPPGFSPDREGVKALFTMLRGAMPDLQIVVDQLVAEGDLVSAFVTFKGTHNGDFMGIPATGKQISVIVSDLMRVQNGKIVEHWGLMDMAGMMRQLGVGAH